MHFNLLFYFAQGLYGTDGKPLMLESANLSSELRNPLIFVCVAFFGALTILLAYVSLLKLKFAQKY